MTENRLTPITDQAELDGVCHHLAAAPFLCVDTEFHRESTYWPTLCLVQIAGPGHEAIIDPMATELDMAPLLALLHRTDQIKVFHAARQDLEIFSRLIGRPPRPVFDTQIAAMALGIGDSVSYDTLVQSILKRKVDKSSQFTDWTRRPLSQKQLTYAMGDVTHLRDVYLHMRERLQQCGRLDWTNAEMAKLEDPELYDTAPERAWKRLKLRKHNKAYTAICVCVAAWREQTAQTLNKPRRHVLKDEAIHEIAEHKPENIKAFERLRSVSNGFVRSRHGKELVEATRRALAEPEKYAPASPLVRRDNTPPAGACEMLKVLLKLVSDEVNVTPRLIASSADLEKLARGERSHDIAALVGWRHEIFGKKAASLLSGTLGLVFRDGKIRLLQL